MTDPWSLLHSIDPNLADSLGHGVLLTEAIPASRAGDYQNLFLAREFLYTWLLEDHELFLAIRSNSLSKHVILSIAFTEGIRTYFTLMF